MFNSFRFHSKAERGFTLIELLVVIAIIGILSSVVLASLNSARSKGRDANRVTDIRQMQLAFELFFDSCGQYPSTLATTASNGCPTGTTLATFLSQIPTPPSGNAQYGYTSASPYTTYLLGATLENTGHPALASGVSSGTAGASPNAVTCNTTTGFCVRP